MVVDCVKERALGGSLWWAAAVRGARVMQEEGPQVERSLISRHAVQLAQDQQAKQLPKLEV